MKLRSLFRSTAAALVLGLSMLSLQAQEEKDDDDGAPPSVFDIGLKKDADSESREFAVAIMRVTVDDNLRTIAFKLYDKDAPLTIANFKRKVEEGYYNGLAIHRAIPGFLVQTGDPLSRNPELRSEWGTGGPGYTVPAEIKKDHKRGVIAMARLNDGVNPSKASHGSQFYISLAKNTGLNDQYTVFGEVIKGLDVVKEIAKAEVDANDNPIARIEVNSIRIIDAGRRIPQTADERIIDKEKKYKLKNPTPEEDKTGLDKFLERWW